MGTVSRPSTLKAIVAVDSKNGIGKSGVIPWYLHDDLARFKAKTTGHSVVMGSATARSLPYLLPNRTSIVITSKVSETFSLKNAKLHICNNLEEALKIAGSFAYVIGGEQVYREALPYCNRVYLTRVDHDFQCDRFFPELPTDEWQLTENEDRYYAPQEYSYYFQTWERTVPVQNKT
jgi:dihydrofolate reductase